MTLKELEKGKTAIIKSVGGDGALRQHFLDMGVIPGVEITLVKLAPMGDPMEFRLHGYELTLRLDDAANIEIDPAPENSEKLKVKKINTSYKHHPGFGESGIYCQRNHDNPLPEGTTLSFALAGNQNSGKTTLFNQLTGSNQHVGNFPGVTVDRKSGVIKGHKNTEVVDLPGIYSLSPYTEEEIAMQLIELDVPMVLALNMMDEMRGNGGSVNINAMETLLGIPVVPISASKNEGVDELINHSLHTAKYQECPGNKDFCDETDHGGAVHRCIHGIMTLIEDHAKNADIPIRFAANKIIEGDARVIDSLNLSENEKEMIEHIILQMEEERGLDRAAAIADMRFSFIDKLVRETVVKPSESKERERSEKIDRILTGKFTALPAFILIMGLISYLTFNVIGVWMQDGLENLITFLTDKMDGFLTTVKVNEVLHSLIINGIFQGIGSVLSFIPIILLLFFFLSLLEDTGYMARVAFVMDRPFRKLGLSGRSIVPLLVGFGCSVPGVMSSRTLPSERDRKMTIMLIPFMSCTAKYPIYGFFAAAFFPGKTALIVLLLYIIGIVVGIITAVICKKTVFKGEAVPFVMELPNYRMPGLKNVGQLLWEKAKDFLTRAFTVIFVATIAIWFLQTFNAHLGLVKTPEHSILAHIAGIIAPIFKPLGFGSWMIVTALITGFMAKESVVSTITILTGGTVAGLLSPLAAFSLLVFCLLYTPCVAAIASVKRELGVRWALIMIVMQCSIAWIISFMIYSIGNLL